MVFEIVTAGNRLFRQRCCRIADLIAGMGGELSSIRSVNGGAGELRAHLMNSAPGLELIVVEGDFDPADVLQGISGPAEGSSSTGEPLLVRQYGCSIIFAGEEYSEKRLREKVLEAAAGGARPVMKVCGLDVSQIEGRLEQVSGEVKRRDLRIYSSVPGIAVLSFRAGTSERALESVAGKLGSYLYARDDSSLSSVVLNLLESNDKTLAVAESVTGGLLASKIISVPGASRVFMEGLVTYSNEAKVERLRIEPGLIRSKGAVSRSVCIDMAVSAADVSSADYALSTTGIAGPAGATPEKDIGLCYIGMYTPEGIYCLRRQFSGWRDEVREKAAVSALDLLRLKLSGFEDRISGSRIEISEDRE